MAKIPLNKFRSRYINITTTETPILSAPEERASILVNCQVANTTSSDITVNMSVSANGQRFPVVRNFAIPANDARSLISGRLILQGVDGSSITRPDVLLIQASSNNAGVLSLGILETVNRD